MVTVDCGVSLAEVRDANALGLDIIITDHHSIPAELPPALAVIDPSRLIALIRLRDYRASGLPISSRKRPKHARWH